MRDNPKEAVNNLRRLGHELREQLDMVGNLIYLAKLPNAPHYKRIKYLALTEDVLSQIRKAMLLTEADPHRHSRFPYCRL